jgi:hypothetical protein
MGRPEGIESVLAAKFEALLPHLDERQRRLAIGAEARSLGHGGIRLVAAAAGAREGTVSRGVAELESGQAPLGRVRRPGGGRKKDRGGPRRVARGTGRKPTLTPADQILVTILYLRKHARQELLGQLFNTTAMTISRAVKDVRPLLEAHGVTVPASTARFRTPDDVASFLDPDKTKIKPAC